MNRVLLSILTIFVFVSAAFAGNTPVSEGPGDKNPIIKSYPNPVTTDVTIEIQLVANNYTKAEVKIVNLLGQEMMQPVKADLEGINNTLKIDVRELPVGVYFMEVTTTAADGTSYTHSKKITKN